MASLGHNELMEKTVVWYFNALWTEWKTVGILQQHFQVRWILAWKFFHFDSNFTEVCPQSPIDNESALVQVITWSMMIQYIDTI